MRLEFVSAGAAQGLVTAVAKNAGVEMAGSFGAVGAMLERFRAGEPCDVVILTNAHIAELAAGMHVIVESAVDLGSVPTAIAVRASDDAIDVSSEAALRKALLAADAIYIPDPARSTAGIHFANVLAQLRLLAEVGARLRTFPNGMAAMRALAEAKGKPIGCTQTTEIFATPGVRLVSPLPKGFDLETVYTAAVNTNAARRDAAADFVARLGADENRKARIEAGFRGYTIRPAGAADASAIRQVVEGVLGEYGFACDWSGVDSDLADIDASYRGHGGLFEVAVGSDGRLAGCCGIFALDAATCELRKMYLLKEARGQGIGGRLLQRALAFARLRGYRRVELETASVLKEAIALYAGAGFVPIKRDHLAARCDQAFALDL